MLLRLWLCFEGHLILIIAYLNRQVRVVHLHDDALNAVNLAIDRLVVLPL